MYIHTNSTHERNIAKNCGIVNASLVNIGLNIFLTTFGAFYTIPSGGFITSYGDLSCVYTPSPQVAVLEEPPGGRGGRPQRGWRPE